VRWPAVLEGEHIVARVVVAAEELTFAVLDLAPPLQAYLLEAVHAQASQLRPREALNRTAARLQHQRAVDEQDRQAVLEAIDDAHADRGARLSRAT
jgi:hypothetical protein